MGFADWPAERIRRIRALLEEEAAVLVQKSGVDFAGGDGTTRSRTKLVRRWPRISEGDRAECEAFLRAYASAKNEEPSRTVTDPMADKEVHPGTWRPTRTDLTRLKTDPNEQGVYQTLVCPADAADGDGEWASEEDWLHHVHTESATGAAPLQLPCGRPPRGTRLSVDVRLDKETGEWDSLKRTDKSRPDTYTFTDGTPLATSEHEKGEHQDAVPRATASPGKTVQINAEMDPYGQYSTHKVETTAHEKSTGSYIASQNALQSTTEESVRNAKKAPDAGDNESVNARVNEFGLVDFNKSKTTPKPKTQSYTSAKNPARTITTEIGRNADAPPNIGEHETATARINELGKLDYEKHSTEPKELSTSFISEKSDEREVTTEIGINAKKVPDAAKNQTVTAHFNEHGLLDYAKHSIDDKGSLGNGYSYAYYGPYTHGVKGKTTITSSKGWKRMLLQWGEWRYKYTVTVQKHTSLSSAQAALNSKTNVSGASITPGGTGIWYSHLTTVEKEWKS